MTGTLRGVSNKHCLLSFFSFVSDLVGNPEDRFSRDAAQTISSYEQKTESFPKQTNPSQPSPVLLIRIVTKVQQFR